MSKDNDPDLNMDEIDRKIDAMPEFDLRDPKNRKKSSVDIDDIVRSLDLEAKMVAAFEKAENEKAENEKAGQKEAGQDPAESGE